MDRRHLITAGIALGFVAEAAPAEASTSKTISIEAPFDVTISSVHADGSVLANDTLFVVSSIHVETYQNQIDLLAGQLGIAARPFADGRLKDRISELSARTALLQNSKEILEQKIAHQQLLIDLGLNGPLTPAFQTTNSTFNINTHEGGKETSTHDTPANNSASIAHVFSVGGQNNNVEWQRTEQTGSVDHLISTSTSIPDTTTTGTNTETSSSSGWVIDPDYVSMTDLTIRHNETSAKLLEAQLAFTQATLGVKDASDRLQLAQAQLAAHQKILQEMKTCLTVTTTVAGNFTAFAMVNSSVKKGGKIGEVVL